MSLATLLANAARNFPDRPAVSLGTRTLFSYRQMGARAARLAAGLVARHGLAPGDRIALALRNCPEYLEILFGAWHAGLAVVPMNAKLHPREMAFMAADCGAKLVLAQPDIAAGLAPILPGVPMIDPAGADYAALLDQPPAPPCPVAPDALAWLFYTSGTTGNPKGAMLSHRNLMAMTTLYLADVDALTERDSLLHVAATSHASGLFGLSFVAKAANNILPPSGGYDGAELAALLDHETALSLFVPPVLLRRMAADPALHSARLDHLRTILVGAAPVHAEDLRAGLAAFGPKLWNGYGQGETPCTITAMRKDMIAEAAAAGDDARLVSVGIARTGIALRLVDAAGQDVPAGEAGEVLVRGETVMQGYWNRPEASAEALRDGWLWTGDMGRMDDRGFLTLLDRRKDVIISGGTNIYAREIEEVLLAHPAVAEAAVIGLPDAEWGESVAAVIVPANAATDAATDPAALAADLDRFVQTRVARFKRPKRYDLRAHLPRNAAGKVLKRVLRDELALPAPPS